ncbi:transposase, partial [Streptosporangium sp. NPDC049644]|uniref:transposase n=1 Tax=Streptosporangium sp. NPDC049644 TaxID=3155507 RepID=UPI003442B0D7
HRREPALAEGEVLMQQVPQRAGGVRLSVRHGHLLVRYPSKAAFSRLANSPKGLSARMLGKEYRARVRCPLRGGHLRSGSYVAASVSSAPLTVLKQHIERRKRPV